jgi:hypothetical protein
MAIIHLNIDNKLGENGTETEEELSPSNGQPK